MSTSSPTVPPTESESNRPGRMLSIEDYRVELDYYSGPLELLLYLVKRHEIDLHDIPIAQLTDQYLEHLETIKQIDIDLAGDFLVMAATLLEIKSRMIAPQLAPGSEGADGEAGEGMESLESFDPRHELVQQLLAYKRYKDAALELDARRAEWESRWAHVPTKLPKDAGDDSAAADDEAIEDEAELIELDLEDVNINDLTEAFARIMASVGRSGPGTARHEIKYDDTPIELHAEDIVDRLTRDGSMSLQQLFVGRTTRSELIGMFLATLELVKLKRVRVFQDHIVGEIKLELRPPGEQLQPTTDDAAADWRDPETGEVQYDWPSEEARQAAERRAKRRLSRFKHMQAGEAVDDEEDNDADIIDFDDDDYEREDDDDDDATIGDETDTDVIDEDNGQT